MLHELPWNQPLPNDDGREVEPGSGLALGCQSTSEPALWAASVTGGNTMRWICLAAAVLSSPEAARSQRAREWHHQPDGMTVDEVVPMSAARALAWRNWARRTPGSVEQPAVAASPNLSHPAETETA